MASITWGTLKPRIARKLKDTGYNKYSETLLMDCINDALAAFAADHTGVATDHTVTGDGSTYEYDLPDDIVDAEGAGVFAVHWEDNTWLSEMSYWPGRAWKSQTRSTASRPRAYVLWPAGKISFTRVPDNNQTVTIHYVAHYPEVTGDESAITVPRWAREPLKLYAAARAIEPVALAAGDLGRWRTRDDAGHPEHNPLLRMTEYFMAQYWDKLSRQTPPQYAKMMPEPEGIVG